MTAGRIPSEFEAKLLAPSEATLRAIARLSAVGAYKLARRDTARLHTFYLDTADLTLTRQGVAFRLRRRRRRWEATIKWEGKVKHGLHERPELNVPLRGQPQMPFQLKHPKLYEQLAARVAGRPLQVVLVSEVRRTRIEILALDQEEGDAPLAEICLDRVHLHGEQSGGVETRYCEVEIEQLDGNRDVVRQVSAELQHSFDLSPSADSKFSRGMALLGHAEALAMPRGDLKVEDTVDSGARKIVWEQLSRLRQHDPGSRRGDDLEALHDMRVAARRLRASLAPFSDAFPPRVCSYLRDELKWLRQSLGEVRDMDVQLGRVFAFSASTPAALRTSLDTYARFLQRRRAEHRKELLAVLTSERYFALLVGLEEYATGAAGMERDGVQRSVGGLVADEIEKAYRRVCKLGRRVDAEPTPEDLHGLRVRAKRLRYTLELCRDLTGRDGVRAIRRLVRLQDLLGNFHDAVVAADFVRQYVEGPGKRAGSTAMITMGAFLANELHRADGMRHDFARTWKRFERKRNRRSFESIIRRLRKDQPSSAPPEPPRPISEDSGSIEVAPAKKEIATELPAGGWPDGSGELDERRPPAKHGQHDDFGSAVVVAGGFRQR
jgi:inorganic triphosphatase YgiF